MKLFDWFRKPEQKDASFETVLRLLAAQQGLIGGVTPETCMRSPTVHAIVTAVSRRFSSTPVHVYEKTTKNGREVKEKLPNHPIAQLLRRPNEWQSEHDYWQDAVSSYLRHGRYIAKISRGTTGPIRRLYPVNPAQVEVKQNVDTLAVTFMHQGQEWPFEKVHFVRWPSRDFFSGDSPVKDVTTTIALEIAAEEYGASFFNNGAVPLLIFNYAQGTKGFKTREGEKQFIEMFQEAFSGNKRHRAFLLPPGIETGDPVKVENDKAQFLQTRQLQRTVIAGAWGIPPYYVGDLTSGKYDNVEQQTEDFTLNVIMPIARAFESAMERDFLTPADRNAGLIIRFNLDAELRASFMDRQIGLEKQLHNGVINRNDWREREAYPPRTDPGGEEYLQSVQTQPNAPQSGGQPKSEEKPDADANAKLRRVS
jgi:HK97 family phage portal protein